MSASYSVFTSPNHAPIPNHLPTLIVTPHGQPHHTLYSYIHTNFNKETYLLTPSPQGDLCVAKMVPPPGSRGPGGPAAASDPGHGVDSQDRSVRCEASRNLKWAITNTGINAPVYKLTLPNPDAPGHEQPLFQISKPNPNAPYWTMFYFTYAGHLIPPKRLEFGKIQKNATQGSGGGGGTRVTITGKSLEEKAVWQTLGEGNEDMVEWIVLCAALNVLDEEIIKAAESSRPSASAVKSAPAAAGGRPTAAVPSSRPSAGSPTGRLGGGSSPMPGGSRTASPRAPMPSSSPASANGHRPPVGYSQQPQQQMAGRPAPNGYPQQQQQYARPQPQGGVRPTQQQPPQQQGGYYNAQQQQQRPPAGYQNGGGQPGYGRGMPPPQQQQQATRRF